MFTRSLSKQMNHNDIQNNKHKNTPTFNTKLTGIALALLVAGTACSNTSANENIEKEKGRVQQQEAKQTQNVENNTANQDLDKQENSKKDNSEKDSSKKDKATELQNQSTSSQESSNIKGSGTINETSNDVLPTLEYSTNGLSTIAKEVNSSNWQPDVKIDQKVGTKLQALLNWNHHGVGAMDGMWGKNTRKAMQAFQKAKGLEVTENLNQETWDALNQNSNFAKRPVLVNYTLTDTDVNIKTTKIPAGAEAKGKLEGMYYESVGEAIAEKFHMDLDYLKKLNPNASFIQGETLTVYNPGNPITTAISRVVADKNSQTLFAYDEAGKLVASYPTTVGSTATPSPTGTHKVKVKVHEPNYTYTAKDGSQTIIPPGANNPVGLVWIGLTKPSYGIHGSPDPEKISRQASSGCVRLTNWDALALFDVIEDGATVEFK